MNSKAKVQWTSISIVALVLCVVLVWWVWIVPRTSQFKAYKRKTEIRARLYNIEPPRGVRVESLEAMELGPSKEWMAQGTPSKEWMALGTYSGFIECDALIAHYKQQFPKQGFTLNGEKEDLENHGKALTFVAPDYQALLTCTGREFPQPYRILMLPQHSHPLSEVRR